jgi:voltage-gated potassium channel Kch
MPALPGRADRHGDHFIVCGDGPLAYRITEELGTRYGEPVTVLLPSRLRNYGPQIAALPRVRVLEHPELSSQAFTDADVESARALAVVWQDDVGNFHAGLRAQELNPALRLVLAIIVVGFALLFVRYSFTNAVYLAMMDLTGSAVTYYRDSGVEKIAQVLLTFDGLAFIPVVTAIIVGARLTGTVRGAPRPPGDHVIVVGLGNVGTSVTGQLHDLGFDVVCIDNKPSAPGIPLARQLGLPVVIGDAFREETLRQASLDTCLALVSGSSGLDWSPHRGYLLASGDRLIVLATRKGLSPFLAVH